MIKNNIFSRLANLSAWHVSRENVMNFLAVQKGARHFAVWRVTHTHTHMYVCQISKVLLAAGTVQHTRNWRFTCKQEEVLEKAVLRDGWSLMSVLLCVLLLAHWLVFVPKEQRKELTLLSTSGRLMICSKLFSVAVHCSAPSSVNETDNHTCRTISSPHYYHHSFFSFNKSETRMTASVLKQDPDTWKVQRNSIYYDKTQHVNFGGKPQRLKGILFIMTKHNMWILGGKPQRLKGILFIMTKHNMWILGASPKG